MAKTAAFSSAVAAFTSGVVINPRLGDRSLPAIGLDTIAVGVDGKRRVIFRPVVGTNAGLAVVRAAGLERAGMEGIDGRTVLGEETEVQARRRVGLDRLLGGAEPQLHGLLAVAQRTLAV